MSLNRSHSRHAQTAAIAEFDKTDVGQTFQGGTDTIPMTSLLDEVPVDIGGDAGAAKDEAGVARLKEREAAKEAVTNEDRAATFEAKQAEGLKLPSLPKFGLSF